MTAEENKKVLGLIEITVMKCATQVLKAETITEAYKNIMQLTVQKILDEINEDMQTPIAG